MTVVWLIAFGFDRSTAVLCIVGIIAAIFMGYLAFDGMRRWWRDRRYDRRFRRDRPDQSRRDSDGGEGRDGSP